MGLLLECLTDGLLDQSVGPKKSVHNGLVSDSIIEKITDLAEQEFLKRINDLGCSSNSNELFLYPRTYCFLGRLKILFYLMWKRGSCLILRMILYFKE